LALRAAAQIAASVTQLEKCRVAAAMRALHVQVLEAPAATPGERARARQALLVLGSRFEALPGHTKSFFQDHLILAHAAWRSGRWDEALRHLRRARKLHPHDPAVRQLAAAMGVSVLFSFQDCPDLPRNKHSPS
jgi:Flp pilus assembly protein TadD